MDLISVVFNTFYTIAMGIPDGIGMSYSEWPGSCPNSVSN